MRGNTRSRRPDSNRGPLHYEGSEYQTGAPAITADAAVLGAVDVARTVLNALVVFRVRSTVAAVQDARKLAAYRAASGFRPSWVRGARWPTRLAWQYGLSWGHCADIYTVTG